ncbi:hypothetical protein KP509_35G012300 [Ceratopteris richardii]|uniref:Phytocyanin domain-containing protein n=1 Tax=Ceratopteris richardii TaxID=49495 RepID=A0A8T2QE10_CERRI|nr:hypothetical protein KP509_35G012300 [Ceratopteris richardii]
MSSAKCLLLPCILLVMCSLMLEFREVMATQYTVGDSIGWGLGHDMETWAAQFKFQVGDELYFPYPAGQHSVLLVTEEDYKTCNREKPVASDNGMGDMAMTLISPQTYYFICGIPGHCEQGLRLKIVVEHEAPSPPQDGPVGNDAPVALTPPAQSGSNYSPPYYNQYNAFRRNSSPKIYVSIAASTAMATFSILAPAVLL